MYGCELNSAGGFWPAAGQNPPALFNSQPYIYIAREDQRYTGGVLGHIDLNDAVKPYLEFNFMNDKTTQVVAPSALFKDSNPNDPISGNYNINCDNPLLSAQEASVLRTPAQIAAAAAAPGTPCSFTTPPGGARPETRDARLAARPYTSSCSRSR